MSPIMRMPIDLTADVARHAVTIGVRTGTTGSGTHTDTEQK